MACSGPAAGRPPFINYQMGFQPAASPVMEQIRISTACCSYIIVRCLPVRWAGGCWCGSSSSYSLRRQKRGALQGASQPPCWKRLDPDSGDHPWYFIAVPSFRLLYFEGGDPQARPTIKAIGKQCVLDLWNIPAPAAASLMTASAFPMPGCIQGRKPRRWAWTIRSMSRYNKVVEIDTHGAPTYHSWAMSQMGVKMTPLPGRRHSSENTGP